MILNKNLIREHKNNPRALACTIRRIIEQNSSEAYHAEKTAKTCTLPEARKAMGKAKYTDPVPLIWALVMITKDRSHEQIQKYTPEDLDKKNMAERLQNRITLKVAWNEALVEIDRHFARRHLYVPLAKVGAQSCATQSNHKSKMEIDYSPENHKKLAVTYDHSPLQGAYMGSKYKDKGSRAASPSRQLASPVYDRVRKST